MQTIQGPVLPGFVCRTVDRNVGKSSDWQKCWIGSLTFIIVVYCSKLEKGDCNKVIVGQTMMVVPRRVPTYSKLDSLNSMHVR